MKRSSMRCAGSVLVFWLVVSMATPLFQQRAIGVDLDHVLEGPALVAACGYDDLGRPLDARIAVGARSALMVAALVVAVSALIGVTVGFVSAWFGGWVDLLIVRLIDVFLAFPGILLAIALAGVLGPGLGNLVIALSAVGWVGFARISRAHALAVLRRDHVMVATALGVGTRVLLIRHVLPLTTGLLIVEATFAFASVIVAEAGLSFLGLGVQPPNPSWGSLIRDGVRYLLVAPHHVIAPSVALMTLVVAVNLLGDRLADRWQDVRHGR